MKVYTADGTLLPLGELLGSGGEGFVYEVQDKHPHGEVVAKIFHDPAKAAEREAKLRYMVQNPPESIEQNGHPFLAWPLELLFDEQGRFTGFLMPKARGVELEYLCSDDFESYPEFQSPEWHKFYFSDPMVAVYRLRTAFNICAAVHAVHEKGYVIGDLKPINIKVLPNGLITLIDLDSIQINAPEVHFPAAVVTPEYAPPESKGIDVNDFKDESWDRFSLAVILYRFLTGIHPFTGTLKPPYDTLNTYEELIRHGFYPNGSYKGFFEVIPPTHRRLITPYPPAIAQTFESVFDTNLFKANKRPSALDWCKVLNVRIEKLSTPADTHPEQVKKYFHDLRKFISPNVKINAVLFLLLAVFYVLYSYGTYSYNSINTWLNIDVPSSVVLLTFPLTCISLLAILYQGLLGGTPYTTAQLNENPHSFREWVMFRLPSYWVYFSVCSFLRISSEKYQFIATSLYTAVVILTAYYLRVALIIAGILSDSIIIVIGGFLIVALGTPFVDNLLMRLVPHEALASTDVPKQHFLKVFILSIVHGSILLFVSYGAVAGLASTFFSQDTATLISSAATAVISLPACLLSMWISVSFIRKIDMDKTRMPLNKYIIGSSHLVLFLAAQSLYLLFASWDKVDYSDREYTILQVIIPFTSLAVTLAGSALKSMLVKLGAMAVSIFLFLQFYPAKTQPAAGASSGINED